MLFCLVLNMFVQKLDSRYERARKPGPGVSANARRERTEGQPSTSPPPPALPSWMIDPDYHQVLSNINFITTYILY